MSDSGDYSGSDGAGYKAAAEGPAVTTRRSKHLAGLASGLYSATPEIEFFFARSFGRLAPQLFHGFFFSKSFANCNSYYRDTSQAAQPSPLAFPPALTGVAPTRLAQHMARSQTRLPPGSHSTWRAHGSPMYLKTCPFSPRLPPRSLVWFRDPTGLPLPGLLLRFAACCLRRARTSSGSLPCSRFTDEGSGFRV